MFLYISSSAGEIDGLKEPREDMKSDLSTTNFLPFPAYTEK